ncbi:MAG TPA: aldo/keto reductase [Steroidobacteraceae bacterium]|jgi:aryl-alcohol dehydrogenase-like predicted oxidoreductase
MSPTAEIPLILGGHTFISQLGSDPAASEHQQGLIVQSCLDSGIRWFDTTYQPERLALGRVLDSLGRRAEASIIAWNFFTDFSPREPVGEPVPYCPVHIDQILEQLRTSYVDCLVLAPSDDGEQNRQQEQLLLGWQKRGYVRSLGLWITDLAVIEHFPNKQSFRFAIRPYNIATDDAASIFAACKRIGWETLATSPFFRGWELDRIAAEAVAQSLGPDATVRPMLADLMLRFTLFQPDVDRVIVAIRKTEWIGRNLESVARGPLTIEERQLLQRLRTQAAGRNRWWRRLLRRL